MNKAFKKRLLLSALIGTFGQVVFLLYVMEFHPVLKWQTIPGSTLLIVGVLTVYNLFAMKKNVFKNSTLGFYAVVINPGLVSIFIGITMVIQDPRFRLISIVSAISSVVFMLIGFVLLTVAITKGGTKFNSHKENI
jgi:hypothetical protein